MRNINATNSGLIHGMLQQLRLTYNHVKRERENEKSLCAENSRRQSLTQSREDTAFPLNSYVQAGCSSVPTPEQRR